MNHYYSRDGITLYHADCRELLETLEPGSVDAVVTDPPYGIGVTRMTLGNGTRRVLRTGDWDDTTPDLSWILGLDVPCIVWGGNYFGLCASKKWLVWDKGTGSNDFADCELAWTNLDGAIRKVFHSWVGRNAKEPGDSDRFHPTQKPIAVIEWCIQQVPESPTTILDPFAGSCTTGVAAWNLGRKAILCEISEEYCELGAKRLDRIIDQGRLFKPAELVETQKELFDGGDH